MAKPSTGASATNPAAPTLSDRIVAWIAPGAGVKRAHARRVLAYFEAAVPSRLNKNRRETGGANDAVLRAGAGLRQIARHLEQNYDLALGVLNTLVNNIVGPSGIGIEPQPRRADGTIDDALAKQIIELYKDWCTAPEVTRQHNWASAQRLLCRSWMRDGEVFSQTVAGTLATLDHRTKVPFSIEMLEADMVPMDLNGAAPLQVVQGIEVNAWGAPTGYHVYKSDPASQGTLYAAGQTKRIPAANMLHIKNVHRIRQMRGVSVFASVLNRFDDLKDYEESERVAAKIAASMAAFIKKGSPDDYAAPTEGETSRAMKMRPGMIFDDLRPGEEIGMIDTNRPNPNLETYRSGQLKAIAAGAGPTFSSIARTYDGTYSAQRQELVEGYAIYGTLANEFIGRIVQPVYEQFIATAIAAGLLKVPAGVRLETLDDAAYMPPAMPWIDPLKEAKAWGELEDRCYVSGPEVIRRRGGNPGDTLEQQSRWLKEKEASDIPVNAANVAAPDSAQMVAEAMAGQMTEVVNGHGQTFASAQAATGAMASRLADVVRAQGDSFADAVAKAAARPMDVTVNLQGAQPAPVVNITNDVHVPDAAAPVIQVHPSAVQVVAEAAAPVINITNEVQPAEVVVNNTHPARAVQTVERDAATDEIVSTITTYER